MKLLSDEERQHLSFEHDTDDLSLPGMEQRAAAYGQFRSAGVMTANEIRRWEGLPPLPDGDKLESPHVQSGKPADTQPPTEPS